MTLPPRTYHPPPKNHKREGHSFSLEFFLIFFQIFFVIGVLNFDAVTCKNLLKLQRFM